MKQPISFRKGIAFYCHKSETDFKRDIYENYDGMVRRQTSLHLADKIWNGYPFQKLLDIVQNECDNTSINAILEVGCGVGRWIASLATQNPQAECWGLDYSYQMLKQADDFWKQEKALSIDMSDRGFPETLMIKGPRVKNLNFGLAKATDLPHFNESQDLVFSNFLIDRIDQAIAAIKEFHRVLVSKGKLILITPLNFKSAQQWDLLYPQDKLTALVEDAGFSISKVEDNISVLEPLDARGNTINWKCISMVAIKN